MSFSGISALEFEVTFEALSNGDEEWLGQIDTVAVVWI